MNRIKAFKNAKEFNELFGMETHNNGVVSRKNAILLTLYKSRSVWDWCRKNDDWRMLSITDMAQLFNFCVGFIVKESHDKYWASNPNFQYRCQLVGRNWYSREYCTDSRRGVCVDFGEDFAQSIRYVNRKRNDQVFKMRVGKFYQKLIMATDFGQMLPQQVVVFVLEELVKEWKTFVMSQIPDFKLVVDDDFERIYKSRYCVGDFESCMADASRHAFYEDSVTAEAAYLEKDDGTIIARCIIFPEVYDADDGKVWRLAERQYSRGGNELYKQLLVNELIKGGYIDGYKRVGAGCGDASSFVDNEGNSLSDHDFYIECDIEHGDTLSYQDSFKCFMPDEGRAFNHWKDDADDDDCLGCTDRTFYGSYHSWDSYHERYARDIVTVYSGGDDYSCDEEDLGEFEYLNGNYYHRSDIRTCPRCGEKYLDPCYYDSEGVYSDILEQEFCCEDCLDEAEREYKEENWFFSDYEQDFYEDRDMLTEYLHLVGNKYILQTVCKKNVNLFVRYNQLHVYNGILVDDISKLVQDDRICEELTRMYEEELSLT